MKKILYTLTLLFSTLIFGQVGINTETPKTTLDVVGKPTETTELDGIIAPRITGEQLRAKTYTTEQTGALVYVTAVDTAPAGQNIDVTKTGYYYFDGTKWVITSGGGTDINIYKDDGTLTDYRTLTIGVESCTTNERVTNGVFPTTGGNTNTVSGWSVGGTYAPSGPWASPTGRVNLNSEGLEFRRDASTITTIQQSLNNVYGDGVKIQFNDLYWNKTIENSTTGSFVFTVSYGGVVYATINSTNTNTPTVIANNGAFVNLNTLPSVNETVTNPNGIKSSKVNLIVTLPNGIPVNGSLLLTFTANSSPTQVRDLGMKSVSVLACASSVCYKPGITTGTALDTKVGITSLSRAGADHPDNWPMVRKGGWIALESKTKGFVPNRVAFAAGNPVGIPVANFVEGMAVYDTTNHCLKVYTLKEGDTDMAWHCITTPACPD